jgi:hypothetical protein
MKFVQIVPPSVTPYQPEFSRLSWHSFYCRVVWLYRWQPTHYSDISGEISTAIKNLNTKRTCFTNFLDLEPGPVDFLSLFAIVVQAEGWPESVGKVIVTFENNIRAPRIFLNH